MNTTMIRKSSLNFKLKNISLCIELHFKRFMAGFLPSREKCPFCGASGSCVYYGTYDRNVVTFCNGAIDVIRLTITRVKCSCRRTHAILPDFIIPYLSFSLPTVLLILWDYFSHSLTVEALCEKYQIVPRTLYRLKSQFLLHKREWLGVVGDMEQTPHSFLEGIMGPAPYSPFAWGFLLLTAFSFIQSHANPANCRHPILPPAPP